MLRCAISHSTPSSLHPSDLQYPYFGGTSKSFQCACRLSRSTKSDCSIHPPWVSQSRAPAPESAATGAWLLHHGSFLRNASRSGVHDSAVAFPFTTCRHFLKSEHMSLCRTVALRLPFLDAILWWFSLQKCATLQPPQVSIGASSPRCCPQPSHWERVLM